MSLRVIPPDFDPRSVEAIDARLDGIAREHDVGIALAIESGSRAWGFPSPDSDYDCRFLFVRAEDDYLSPWSRRDVIETPLDRELDVNGWELGKALKLLLKGNAVVIEWAMSPIIYRGDARFHDDLISFAETFASREGLTNHYLHLGERQRRTYFADGKQLVLKKIFYALRPAAALRWLRMHPEARIAPMHFPTLMAEADPPADVLEICNDLIARKAVTRELGKAPLPRAVERFIDGEFDRARAELGERCVRLLPAAKDAADTFFRAAVRRLGSTSAPAGAKEE